MRPQQIPPVISVSLSANHTCFPSYLRIFLSLCNWEWPLYDHSFLNLIFFVSGQPGVDRHGPRNHRCLQGRLSTGRIVLVCWKWVRMHVFLVQVSPNKIAKISPKSFIQLQGRLLKGHRHQTSEDQEQQARPQSELGHVTCLSCRRSQVGSAHLISKLFYWHNKRQK